MRTWSCKGTARKNRRSPLPHLAMDRDRNRAFWPLQFTVRGDDSPRNNSRKSRQIHFRFLSQTVAMAGEPGRTRTRSALLRPHTALNRTPAKRRARWVITNVFGIGQADNDIV